MALATMLLAAVLASLVADWVWYAAGRRFGYRVLALLCKMSINPSSCVNQTEARFAKWGVWSLVFGKFIPGFATVAPPVAGALGMAPSSFFMASAMGAGLWAGMALLAGYAFQAQIDGALVWMAAHGIHLALIGTALVAVVIGWKYWQKARFERLAAMQHIDIHAFTQALAGPRPPHVIDLRSHSMASDTGFIPNAPPHRIHRAGTLLGGYRQRLPHRDHLRLPARCGSGASGAKPAEAGLPQRLPAARRL
jgi:membrane protein DedA with SNARE-associated domain